MSDVLLRIKRAVIAGNVIFTSKAEAEMEADRLLRTEVQESIIYAHAIRKTIRSTRSGSRRDKLYIIIGNSLRGISIYTKGKLIVHHAVETYYVLISSKRATEA